MPVYHTTIDDVAAIVHYTVSRPSVGRTDGPWGLQLEPDEYADIEIDWIEGPSGLEIDVPAEKEIAIAQEIMAFVSQGEEEESRSLDD